MEVRRHVAKVWLLLLAICYKIILYSIMNYSFGRYSKIPSSYVYYFYSS